MFGKRSRTKLGIQVRDVEHDAVVAGALELGVDRARHDVARREIRHLVVARHEGVAAQRAQDAALAAHRLA